MGTLTFRLPDSLPPTQVAELEQACIAGGQDCMPYLSQVLVDENQLYLTRQTDESGFLAVPWLVDGMGMLMSPTATLMERLAPYHLPLELARGKINQLRGQAADWIMGGLIMPAGLPETIRDATFAFARAVSKSPQPEAFGEAQLALEKGYDAAQRMVRAYVDQVFQVRHLRQPKLESLQACRLHGVPAGEMEQAFLHCFNTVAIPFSWKRISPTEKEQNWSEYDALVAWAEKHQLTILGGPLLDFAGQDLPDWLWSKPRDIQGLGGRLCDFAETAVRRYKGKIRHWQTTAASNWAGTLAQTDEELLWLTHRIADAVRRVDPLLEISIGIAHPFGDYLACQERAQSPFVFVDTLMRTGLKFGAIDVEIAMGISPRGSYVRDTLDVSRILDLYALLGSPLQVTLAYPASAGVDANADPDLRVEGGWWRGTQSAQTQADWARSFSSLALCKPFVRSVVWSHLSDAEPHQFPHCGLFDARGQARPALETFAELRSQHLK
ncbi:MAG: hypothetical protein K2X38_06580 [Gemmataceae bacterium]|nr:hypothetical protein [Gemmataceae bacterium]